MAELLAGVTGGGFVVVNAVEYADLDVVVLGLLEAAAAGRSFLYRSGPSFVQSLAGWDPRDPLRASDPWPAGHPAGHGLVVVGSHVGLTSRQVAVTRDRGGLAEVELDVAAVADPARRDGHVAEATRLVVSALDHSDVLLVTSRELRRGRDATESLEISRRVSTAATEVVRGALPAKPAWVVAKGGITSHDVAVHGLGIRGPRSSASCSPAWCRSSARSTPPPRLSARLCRVRRQRRRRDDPGVGRRPGPRGEPDARPLATANPWD